jgi:hypothetical protein
MSSLKQSTQFDLTTVQQVYENSEYVLIIDRQGVSSRRAVVLFSSNGIFFPNTEEEASKALIDKNRFEWQHTLPLECSRIILVRDVYKTWYLRGVSKNVPDPLSLASLLRGKLAGWDVQMAGVSSGGYAAVLFGCLLGVRRVFSLSGQFNLRPMLDNPQERELNPWVVRASEDPLQKMFLDLRHYFAARSPEIYYVAPKNSYCDKAQLQIAETEPRIRMLGVDSDKHDVNLLRPALRRLFQRSSKYMDNLVRLTPSSGWDKIELSRRIAGNRRHFSYLLRRRRDLLYRQISLRSQG